MNLNPSTDKYGVGEIIFHPPNFNGAAVEVWDCNELKDPGFEVRGGANGFQILKTGGLLNIFIYLYRVNHIVTLFFHGALLLQSMIHRYKEHTYKH